MNKRKLVLKQPFMIPPNKYQNIIKIIISISIDKLDLSHSTFISSYDNCSSNTRENYEDTIRY
jgi:hypothetical protein